jgi:hypothetical protein
MRTFAAVVLALFGAAIGFTAVGFLGCWIALTAESIALAFVTIFLAIGAAIVGGYLGAKIGLEAVPSNDKNRDATHEANQNNKSRMP